jgi:hypothetical protein
MPADEERPSTFPWTRTYSNERSQFYYFRSDRVDERFWESSKFGWNGATQVGWVWRKASGQVSCIACNS